MTFNNNQFDPPPSIDDNVDKTSLTFLPKYFRTSANQKFLNATIDQMISEGDVEKISAFIGRKSFEPYRPVDKYLEGATKQRQDYQFEPAVIIKDNLDNVDFFKDYPDYINQLSFFNSGDVDHNKINSQEFYAWNPHIDWDKFVNYRDYYWLPLGPTSIPIAGQSSNITSTYTVSVVDDIDNRAYLFTPDGLTRNPTLRLYRGQTYRFEVNCPGNGIAFKTVRETGDSNFYTQDISTIAKIYSVTNNGAGNYVIDGANNPTINLLRGFTYVFDVNALGHPFLIKTTAVTGTDSTYSSGVTNNGAEVGTVTFTVPLDAPDTLFYACQFHSPMQGTINIRDAVPTDPFGLTIGIVNRYVESGTIEFTVSEDAPNVIYYVSENSLDTGGVITIYDITESTSIDVEKEIIGKKEYTSSNDVILSNGMKIFFQGRVSPEKYADGNWYVEGVGSAIKLVKETDLSTPAPYSTTALVEFDNEKFDSNGFDVAANVPSSKEYLLINRASNDLNPWSRYNRWFHKDVVATASLINRLPEVLDQTARATRPIIEFEANLKLWNFGTQFKNSVTLVDTFTRDVFSTIEGSLGYNIDGVDLIEGMRILFLADNDVTVYGKIFKVKFITHLGTRRITLIAEPDADSESNQTILVLDGAENKGKMFYFDGDIWNVAQTKQTVNQPPLFDIFDSQGVGYGNTAKYDGTTFAGTKLFSYRQGTNIDSELGFGISYKNIGNIGDIIFDFNLQSDTFIYKNLASVDTIEISKGFLKKSESLTSHSFVNGWEIAKQPSKQYVIRQFDGSQRVNFFPIDVYALSGLLTDLQVKVFVNGKIISELTDYSITIVNDEAFVELANDITESDSLVIKTISSAAKTENGYYEIPANFESNPINLGLGDCTLGQVINHVKTITDSRDDFRGTLPGTGNLRDLSDLSAYGSKIVQHSGPLAPAIYHFTDKQHNVIKALRYAKDEYSKFKRNFIRIATDYGFDGITRVHFDLIMKELVKDRVNTMPFFFTDMVPFSGSVIFNQEIIDDSITEYPLIFDFDLNTLSEKAVLVYLNEEQLLHGRDYQFINENFVSILAPIAEGDTLEVIQYENTNGCFVPPTPSKLGLYPLFEPKIYVDNTYQTPTRVIQGHDGNILKCFDDFRDQLLLELETRIYNNIKVQYDTKLFDILDFTNGFYRKADVTKKQLDDTLRQDFLKWSRFIADDYTKHSFYNDLNSYTYNYRNFSAFDDTVIPGFWRGIYKYFYDTDRPHICPWEMLGFTQQPTWWTDQYGPAPYTSDNQ
jgi:hypothetical protein